MPIPHWSTREAPIVIPARRRDVIVDTLDEQATVSDPLDGTTYHLNETALEVWKQCNGARTTRQLAGCLTRRYDVEFDVALDHVEQLAAFFARSGLLATGDST